jgi:hypothetical protein
MLDLENETLVEIHWYLNSSSSFTASLLLTNLVIRADRSQSTKSHPLHRQHIGSGNPTSKVRLSSLLARGKQNAYSISANFLYSAFALSAKFPGSVVLQQDSVGVSTFLFPMHQPVSIHANLICALSSTVAILRTQSARISMCATTSTRESSHLRGLFVLLMSCLGAYSEVYLLDLTLGCRQPSNSPSRKVYRLLLAGLISSSSQLPQYRTVKCEYVEI